MTAQRTFDMATAHIQGEERQDLRDRGDRFHAAAQLTERLERVPSLRALIGTCLHDGGRAAALLGRTAGESTRGREGGDAAGIVFDGVKQATATGEDVLIVDTAGRLQNKTHLMDELSKIRRVLGRLNPEAPHDILLVLDATTGQNALAQVEVFRETAGVTGLIMTKLDGTARGGVLVAAAERFGLPIHAIGVGEKAEDLRPFDPRAVARAIAGLPPE